MFLKSKYYVNFAEMSKTAPLSFWESLENIKENLQGHRLADVFRFISFYPRETYGFHKHLRIEINYVKRGSCILHLDNESIGFREGELMIITSNVNHLFEAGVAGVTLMQLEFLPDIFSQFNKMNQNGLSEDYPTNAFLFSEKNKVVKIVNNIRITRAVQRIVNELKAKNVYYEYLVVMYYAELLILIYRYLDEANVVNCTSDYLRTAVSFIRTNFHRNINVADVAKHTGISERYLRSLFLKNLNLGPLDFLNQVRINKAMDFLRNTNMSIKEISFQCGFQSPQYFSRVFKQQTGFTPRKFIE